MDARGYPGYRPVMTSRHLTIGVLLVALLAAIVLVTVFAGGGNGGGGGY